LIAGELISVEFGPLKLAFSTLGCPKWGIEQIAETAAALGYHGIELRALGGDIDLLRRSELQPGRIRETRRLLERYGVAVCCIDTACSFHASDRKTRLENLRVALDHARIAGALGAGLIRVFPNEVPEGATRRDTCERIAFGLHELARRLPPQIRVGLETHGAFATGNAAAELARSAGHPNVAIVWDVANTIASGEDLRRSAAAVASDLAHVHLRDARPVAGERFWLPVLAGHGRIAFADVVAALREVGYDGYVCFEWEKYWHPEIEDPEIALADFASSMENATNATKH
jgi:sugar phosphate isomerase/epimerase